MQSMALTLHLLKKYDPNRGILAVRVMGMGIGVGMGMGIGDGDGDGDGIEDGDGDGDGIDDGDGSDDINMTALWSLTLSLRMQSAL